jgi:hypothetical protein
MTLDAQLDQHGAQRDDTPLAVGEASFAKQKPVFCEDTKAVLLLCPRVQHTRPSAPLSLAHVAHGTKTDRRVPLRLLIGRRFGARRGHVAASGAPHRRREARVSCGPSTHKGLAKLALSRRWSASLRASQSEASRTRRSRRPSLRTSEHRKVAL